MAQLWGWNTWGPISALSLVMCSQADKQPAPEAVLIWSQLGPEGVSARYASRDPLCPSLRWESPDGAGETELQVRAGPSQAFPDTVCEAHIPGQALRASVAGRELALLARPAQSMVIVGDTGCRLGGGKFQACNDPEAWPLVEIAQAAADLNPDVVVHVGDFLYREAPCPAGNKGCEGSAWGPNLAGLSEDLFVPARPLLGAAPLLLTRGNHESCGRDGAAWFRYFHYGPVPEGGCEVYADPYSVDLGRLRVVVMDSSHAGEETAPPEEVAEYKKQLEAISQLPAQTSWLLSHRPFWGVAPDEATGGVEVRNVTLEAAAGHVFPPWVDMVLSGHIHLFELLQFSGGRPPQVVVGNSGTLLAPPLSRPVAGLDVDGETVTHGSVHVAFGFAHIERSVEPDVWSFTLFDKRAQPLMRCEFVDGVFGCQ